ncbi:HAD-IA family hydrolase [Caldimonas brevitalea]|uniref:Haloacid dehalogenase n=1 Tax=Caldimonas brevitalea TaxID=413882 RepID=A0A0G3BQN3_9BURK|nr:HAD-IA family hydrolase [Caldimonas brevitalea]AKJ31754.1 haloacid dehalogenase [Caldimonas brevitalea]
MLRCVIWDIDGTVAETERDGHRVAFNLAFASLGLPWRWDIEHYGGLLGVTGGYERLLFDMQARPDAPPTADEREGLARELHRRKNRYYTGEVLAGGMPLRPGVRELMDECAEQGVKLGIATTTGRANVDALLRGALGAGWRARFDAVVCAEEAPLKKPHPQVYRLALQQLECAPGDAVAVEDAPNGLAAAQAAGIPTLVTRSLYFRNGTFDAALAVCDDLTWPQRVSLDLLRRWLQRWQPAMASR